MLDTPTLLLGFAVDDLVLAAALWLAVPRGPSSGAGAWSASLLLQASACALFAGHGSGGLATAAAVAADGALALALTLQLSALAAQQRRPFARPWHLAAALGCALVGAGLAAHPAARVAALSLAYGAALVAIGVVARRHPVEAPGRGQRLLAWSALAGGALLFLRAPAAALWPQHFGGEPQAGWPTVAAALIVQAIPIATSLGFLLMNRERQEREHARLAMTDGLTGVYNRRTLFELGEKELLRARRTGASLSIVLLDVDHFKRVNDKYGNLGGDAVLLRFVEVVRGCLRQSDVLTRYGGEQFCILLPGVGRAGARVVGERIRATIEASTFFVGAVPLRVTSSVGVAELSGDAAATLSSLVARADQALYIAKRDGRNRVSVAAA